jgi:hypothetical protein
MEQTEVGYVRGAAQEIVRHNVDGDVGPSVSIVVFPLRAPNFQGKRRPSMHVAIAVAFAMILAAPFFGRWRANVWLKANMPEEQTTARVPETA